MNGPLTLKETAEVYLENLAPQEHAVLTQLRLATQQHYCKRSAMPVTPSQGRFLAWLIQLTGSKQVLELGTFTGYSTLAIALALPKQGTLTTLDINADTRDFGAAFWRQAGMSERIMSHIGPALATLAQLHPEPEPCYDFIFIDANKPLYTAYYERCLPLLRPGGLLILDNVLLNGRACQPSNHSTVRAMQALNKALITDQRVSTCTLPVADGMTLLRKK